MQVIAEPSDQADCVLDQMGGAIDELGSWLLVFVRVANDHREVLSDDEIRRRIVELELMPATAARAPSAMHVRPLRRRPRRRR